MTTRSVSHLINSELTPLIWIRQPRYTPKDCVRCASLFLVNGERNICVGGKQRSAALMIPFYFVVWCDICTVPLKDHIVLSSHSIDATFKRAGRKSREAIRDVSGGAR